MLSEQAMGEPEFSSDIYAVGMIGLQALTGVCPGVLKEKYKNKETGEIDWLHLADVSDDLGDLLHRMIRYDYRQRYISATEVLDEIKYNKYVSISTKLIADKPE